MKVPTIDELREEFGVEAKNAFKKYGEEIVEVPLLFRVFYLPLANLGFSLYKWLFNLRRLMFPQNVTDPVILNEFFALYGIVKKPGTKAVGRIIVDVLSPYSIPAGTAFVYQLANGHLCRFLVDQNTAQLTVGKHEVQVTSDKVGGACNLDYGVEVALESPTAEVSSQATVLYLTGGTDKETDFQAKKRLLLKLEGNRGSGTKSDYVSWTSAVNGVYRVFVYGAYPNGGQVTVHFIINSEVNFMPNAAKIEEVKVEIARYSPLAIPVTVGAPGLYSVDMDIQSLTIADGENLDNVRNRIKSNLRRYFLQNAETSRNSVIKVSNSVFGGVISNTVGEVGHTLVIDQSADGEISIPERHVAGLGTLKFDGVAF